MEPKIFFIGDGGVCMITKMGDVRLSTSNRGAKEKMSCSESEVVLVITWEGEAEWCGCAVCCKVHMMDKATVQFFEGTVEVCNRGGETHCMAKFLASEGLTGVAKGAEGPAAVRCMWEAV